MIEIKKGDFFDLSEEIKDGSVDLIIADPPYGGLTKNKWDKKIDIDKMFEIFNRVIKKNGAILVFSQGMFTAELMIKNKKYWRYNLVWKKGRRVSGFLNAKRMPLRNHEDIIVFYKNPPIYNPIYEKGRPNNGCGRLDKAIKNSNYRHFKLVTPRKTNLKYPKSILDRKEFYEDETAYEGEMDGTILNFCRDHPAIFATQKPISLYEYLIRTYSNENEMVLDPFCGSGTCPIACNRTKRSCISYELNDENYDLALKRFEKEKYSQPTLFE